MSSTLYPAAIDTYVVPDVQPDKTARSAQMRLGLDAVIAVETVLGVNPQSASPTVSARIGALELQASTVATVVTTDATPVLVAVVNIPVGTAAQFQFQRVGVTTGGAFVNTGSDFVSAANSGSGASILDNTLGYGIVGVGVSPIYTVNGDDIEIRLIGQADTTIAWKTQLYAPVVAP